MKVHWRVIAYCTVVFAGWIAAEEVDRKLIIHLPHVHRPKHKHVTRQTHKPSSHHSKGHDRPGDHVHKHHHHFHDEEYGEGNHGHGYEDHGHHHTRKYRRQPHHHHSSSGHHHHHSHPSHHHDHHDSHHVDHHHDDEYHPRYKTEESRYHYDHYSEPSHHHHRPMRYEEDEDYDCMEVCEKCKMHYHRKHMRESEGSASRPHPQLTVAKFKPTSSSSGTSSFMSRIKEDFQPSLAAGELSESPTGYDENKYAGFVMPTAIDHAANAGRLSSINVPLRSAGNTDNYGPVFPNFQSSEFMPSGSWQNGSLFYGQYKDPAEKVVEYNVPRGQMKHVRYGEEEIRHEDSKSNDERGRNLRYLNRYKYNKR